MVVLLWKKYEFHLHFKSTHLSEVVLIHEQSKALCYWNGEKKQTTGSKYRKGKKEVK